MTTLNSKAQEERLDGNVGKGSVNHARFTPSNPNKLINEPNKLAEWLNREKKKRKGIFTER